MGKFLLKLLSISYLTFLLFTAADIHAMGGGSHMDAAHSILTAFSLGCKSYGTWTEAALVQTRSLESVITELKGKEDCSGLSAAISNSQGLSAQIQALAGDPTQIQLKEAQETKRQLLIELKTATDSNLQQLLSTSLAQAEVDLAQAKAAAAVQGGKAAMVNNLSQATSFLNALLTDPNLSRCAIQYPNLGVQIGSQVLGIAGTFVNPAIGVATSSVGQLLSNLISFARNFNLDKAFWKLQTTEMAISLSCGLESMQNTYCTAEDQYQLAKLQADSYLNRGETNEFWNGLNLWSNKVPALMAWLAKIATGVKPTDPSGADRQNKVWEKLGQLNSLDRSVQGLIGSTRRLLQASGDDSEQIIRRAISTIESVMGFTTASFASGSTNVLSDFFPTRTHVLYRLVGLPLDCNPGGIFGGGNCKDEQTIDLPSGGFEVIASNIQGLFAEIRKILLNDLHLVIDLDSQGLLIEATQKRLIGKESPLEVLRDMITFLDRSRDYLSKSGDPDQKQAISLIQETRSLLLGAVENIQKATGELNHDQKLMSELFDSLKLVNGTDFLSERFYRHVKWELNSRIIHGDIPKDIEEILLVSGNEAADELDVSTQSNLDTLLSDINAAQAISQQNIRNFATFYEKGFNVVLKKLKKEADLAMEPHTGPKRPNRSVLSRICILLAAGLPKWPVHIDQALCQGALIESIYPGFREQVRFSHLKSELDQGVPLEKRMCRYRNFLRRSMIYSSTQPFPEANGVPSLR